MTIGHPTVKKMIADWQERLREVTDNKTLVLTCYSPPTYNIEFGILSKVVCDAMAIPIEQIRKRNRKKEIVIARQLLAFYCTRYTDMSLKKIGLLIGGKDHTTIIHSKNKVQDMIDSGDSYVCDAMMKIDKELEQYRPEFAPEVATA